MLDKHPGFQDDKRVQFEASFWFMTSTSMVAKLLKWVIVLYHFWVQRLGFQSLGSLYLARFFQFHTQKLVFLSTTFCCLPWMNPGQMTTKQAADVKAPEVKAARAKVGGRRFCGESNGPHDQMDQDRKGTGYVKPDMFKDLVEEVGREVETRVFQEYSSMKCDIEDLILILL